ncbi:biopolymer transport protein ExbB [Rhodothalassium salexigens DSM 2132]|uniref:Biopolymer transport protein ExbB n=1 Tax=Rhodothalassium salexigens DSM 2132 TaxID=1188247 RepID=A0A4R2PC22_RHOSA|nr:MotA/TolQ/ExbB proton channel family protein [Rhodothalassium salexigens]MBB4212217.1 biopolymer transport protein ExbB [Rhodothalassium salexigens DSM 2132]MBK1639526.1 hypothetical protein [Rhodothalassium salexigens DSM 2132]TCP32632.1 biopolymer transport protein ExbB [Rhodothalassium salexigens DSM 2132]
MASLLASPMFWSTLPLALCSVVAAALIADRLIAMARTGRLDAATRQRIDRALDDGAPGRALDALTAERPFFARSAHTLAHMAAAPKALRDEATSVALGEDLARLTRRRSGLVTLAALAPMLGLLGTVVGMMEAFRALEALDGPVEPAVVAGGLWQALITTGIGLSIAVPCLLVSAWVRSWAGAQGAAAAALLTRVSIALEARELRVDQPADRPVAAPGGRP